MEEKAMQLRRLIEITANNLSDDQAQEVPYCFPEWKEGMEIKEGERYRVQNNATARFIANPAALFKCKKTHIATVENFPEESPELWEEL